LLLLLLQQALLAKLFRVVRDLAAQRGPEARQVVQTETLPGRAQTREVHRHGSLLSRHAFALALALAVDRVQNQIANVLADRTPVRPRGRLKRSPKRRLNPNRQLLTLARVLCHAASVFVGRRLATHRMRQQ
jgi:hypothetical protein